MVVWLADLVMIWGNSEEWEERSLRFLELLSFLRTLVFYFWELLWWECSVWQSEMCGLEAVLVRVMS